MNIDFETKTHKCLVDPATGHIIATDKHPRMTARQDWEFNIDSELDNPSSEQKLVQELGKHFIEEYKRQNPRAVYVSNDGYVSDTDMAKIKEAVIVLENCIHKHPVTGKMIDGKAYRDLILKEDSSDVVQAIKIVADVYGLTQKDFEVEG